MYNQPESAPLQTIYQMDPNLVDSMHHMKSNVHTLCSQYMNHPVQIQTIHGQVFEGYIVHVDSMHLYLRTMPGHVGQVRGFFNPFPSYYNYNNVILPLVLYELLVISLL
ncbi:hypothetical protein [Paenibacillus rigui]|uniref:Acetyl-CoA acetyltransferase n=1 Tax=Paenibacillus rigui TaxID=554312 RepID=A0A229ULU9_9BACL|nr:hypothetical protein [Paenibacillus rigui]OXM84265.1 acetyl-CoA acetyltransferase [Paenibacillus rigui]